MKRFTCRFMTDEGLCCIGCRSMNVAKGGACPYSYHLTKEKDTTCPCHHGSLTFILAEKAGRFIKDIIGGCDGERDD